MKKILEIDGKKVATLDDFYDVLEMSGILPDHFGGNGMALWDSLTGDVERPLKIIWNDSHISRQLMTIEVFDRLFSLIRRVEQIDIDFGSKCRLELELR